MDIKAKIDEIVKKLKADPKLMENFTKDPSATIKKITGLDVPKDQIDGVVSTVKSKINLDSIGGTIGGLFGKK